MKIVYIYFLNMYKYIRKCGSNDNVMVKYKSSNWFG